MAKTEKKIKARKLRSSGKSIKTIARILNVSQSSASIWCRDIELSTEQKIELERHQKKGSYIGRIKGAETRKRKRVEETEALRSEGIKEISKLTSQSFFAAGVGLYWGEGTKTGGITGIVNSDPKAILFMMSWFKRFCGVRDNDFICRVGINSLHKNRIEEVERYWHKTTGIPRDQFTKTSLYKSILKKKYDNQDEYFGTLRLKIRNGTQIQRKILGWIEGLYLGGVAQGLEHSTHKAGVGGSNPPAATNITIK